MRGMFLPTLKKIMALLLSIMIPMMQILNLRKAILQLERALAQQERAILTGNLATYLEPAKEQRDKGTAFRAMGGSTTIARSNNREKNNKLL